MTVFNIRHYKSKVVHQTIGDLAYCGANLDSKASNPHDVIRGVLHGWDFTEEPANCKRCLARPHSKCCNAPVLVAGRTTHHYECAKCGKDCDVKEATSA